MQKIAVKITENHHLTMLIEYVDQSVPEAIVKKWELTLNAGHAIATKPTEKVTIDEVIPTIVREICACDGDSSTLHYKTREEELLILLSDEIVTLTSSKLRRRDTGYVAIQLIADESVAGMQDYLLELYIRPSADENNLAITEWVLTPPHRSTSVPRLWIPLHTLCEQMMVEIYDLTTEFQDEWPENKNGWKCYHEFYDRLYRIIKECVHTLKDHRHHNGENRVGSIPALILLPPK